MEGTNQPKQIATSTDNIATGISNAKRPFFDRGLWWIFYSDGRNIICRTSGDLSIWSNPTNIATLNAETANNYGIYGDPSNHRFYYVKAIGGTQFSYRYGTTSSGGCGSIGWAIPESGVTTTNTGGIGPHYPSIAVDSGGNLWVLTETFDSLARHVHLEFWEGTSCSPACVWTDTQDFGPPLTSGGDYQGVILPLNGGKLTAYYSNYNGGGHAYIQDWTGSAWLPRIDMSVTKSGSEAHYFEVADGCGIANGDTTYWSGLAGGTWAIESFFKHNYGDSNVPSMTMLDGGSAIKDTMGCMAWNGGSTIWAFYWTFWNYQNDGPATTIWYRQSNDGGNTWLPRTVLTSAANTLGPKGVDVPLTPANNQLLFLFTDSPSSPYSIKYMAANLG